MLSDLIISVIGPVPPGWEFVPYLLAAVTYLLGLVAVYGVISIPLSLLRGR